MRPVRVAYVCESVVAHMIVGATSEQHRVRFGGACVVAQVFNTRLVDGNDDDRSACPTATRDVLGPSPPALRARGRRVRDRVTYVTDVTDMACGQRQLHC